MNTKFVIPRRLAGFTLGGIFLAIGWVIPAGADAGSQGGGLRESLACLDCHENAAASLQDGPHWAKPGAADAPIFCTDCHAGEAGHWEDDPASYPMANPGDGNVVEVFKVCSNCHDGPHALNQGAAGPHPASGMTCLDCHQVHGHSQDYLLKDRQPELCYTCHQAVRGDFAKPYRHPAGDREFLQCSNCHLADDNELAGAALQGTNAVCLQCHPEFQGPFPYEHQATVDYGTDEGGCLACHEPHGSTQPRLLKQPYASPHFQTCSQCHVVPLHDLNSQHGSDWAGMSCSECHVDIHGSYVDKNFLTPVLEAQGCFAVGCHSR